MAVGDAAGLVDPVTGEGLYYAFRSGDLASQALLNDAHPLAERADIYRRMMRHDFLEDLIFGAGLAKRFFIQRFLFSTVPARMIEFMRRSPRFREIVQDLFAGTQGYLDLKKRLMDSPERDAARVVYGNDVGDASGKGAERMKQERSRALLERAEWVIPGGVNSPVRAFRSVGGTPLFIAKGEGSRITDVDGNQFVDYVGSWGSADSGAPVSGCAGSDRAGARGGDELWGSDGAGDRAGGGDTVGGAIDGDGAAGEFRDRGDDERAAGGARVHGTEPDGEVRGVLPRTRRFAAGEGGLGGWRRSALRIPAACRRASRRRRLRCRSIRSMRWSGAFAERGSDIAAVIVEPVVGNMGCVPPKPGYLQRTARHHGAARGTADFR